MPYPTVPLTDGNLLRHGHQILTLYPHELDPTLQRVQVSLVATHIGEVSSEMNRDIEVKALAC